MGFPKTTKFKFGDLFEASNPLHRWLVSISVARNDLIFVNRLLEEAVNQKINKSSFKRFYFFRLAMAHFSEAIKSQSFYEKKFPAVKKFISESAASGLYQKQIRPLYDPWKGSFMERIVKEVRDDFFHYPHEAGGDFKLQSALNGLTKSTSSILFDGPAVNDMRFLYADDVCAGLYGEVVGIESLEENSKKVHDGAAFFIKFVDEIVRCHLSGRNLKLFDSL